MKFLLLFLQYFPNHFLRTQLFFVGFGSQFLQNFLNLNIPSLHLACLSSLYLTLYVQLFIYYFYIIHLFIIINVLLSSEVLLSESLCFDSLLSRIIPSSRAHLCTLYDLIQNLMILWLSITHSLDYRPLICGHHSIISYLLSMYNFIYLTLKVSSFILIGFLSIMKRPYFFICLLLLSLHLAHLIIQILPLLSHRLHLFLQITNI